MRGGKWRQRNVPCTSNVMSLYKNIHKKRKRIKEGSKEKMRKPGTKGAPTDAAFAKAKKTAKKPKKRTAKA